MRKLRERAREARHNDGIPDLADTALLEALRVAYIKGSTYTMRDIFEVMVTRANQRCEPGFEMLFAMLGTKSLADIHAQGREWIPYPNPSVTVTNSLPAELERANAEVERLKRENLVMAERIAERPRTEPKPWPPELEAEFQAYLKERGCNDVMVTNNPTPQADHVVTVTKDYPPEVKAQAVAMHQAGQSSAEIRAWLVATVGKAPDTRNMSKALRRWAKT